MSAVDKVIYGKKSLVPDCNTLAYRKSREQEGFGVAHFQARIEILQGYACSQPSKRSSSISLQLNELFTSHITLNAKIRKLRTQSFKPSTLEKQSNLIQSQPTFSMPATQNLTFLSNLPHSKNTLRRHN